ncbi:permease component [Cohnella kolymensis]|uniref:Permease component n=1 Tax=Cohnella kolymensis TaxID=1590652 RepID=A0ABR5A2Y9_9BACL|nr:ABC transporter permease [Cohnella kolymensis]KIL35429.1 permease component [Cohnella kolymensis]
MNALIRFLFRKMWNTRWLTLSTLAGLFVAVAFTTSIPMYADGALKRVVAQSLVDNSQGLPAGSLLIRYQSTDGKTDLSGFENVDSYIRKDVPEDIGFPAMVTQRSLTLRGTEVSPEDPTKVDASRTRKMTIASFSDLKEQSEMAGGTWYSDRAAADGTIQAVMMEEAMFRNDLHVGDVLLYPIFGGLDITLRVEIVGSFKPANPESAYWYQGLESLMNNLYIADSVMLKDLAEKQNIPLQMASWYTAYDLREIQTSQLSPLAGTLNRIDIEVFNRLKDTHLDISFADMLGDFRRDSIQLQTLLFTLAAPMIAMVFYFITMNASQALEKQRSDIAVLRSRGASTRQIFMLFLLEGSLLGIVALVLGPFFGWFMAKSIGSASGFLSFVDRQSIPVGFSSDGMIAGIAAVLVAIGAAVIPAVLFTRTSIVDHKRQMARTEAKPFWQRWFLDVLLLGVAAYGWYLFNERQMISFKTGMTTDQLNVQPFLFFVPALSIFAAGLVFLRLFPLLLKLFNLLWKRVLPVSMYLTVTQLSRSARSYYPLMILLILTLGLGVYNSSAARTIGLNSEERIMYKYGSDVVVKTVWEGMAEFKPIEPGSGGGGSGGGGNGGGGAGGGGGSPGGGGGGPGGGGGAPPTPTRIIYNEPPFEVFRTLPGVEHAARVLRTPASLTISGKTAGQVTIMGIDNVDFARVGWLRKDMYRVNPYKYLAWMGQVPQGALISSNVAEKFDLKRGDEVKALIQEQEVYFAVLDILPYWPSQYPQQTPFLIANLDYVYDQVPMIPYDIWLKMKPGAKTAPIIPVLQGKGIELATIDDMRSELVTQSKHPARGGVFGILSLGFLVTVIVSLSGYVLFWFFNLSRRVVQIGILRAMGLSRKQLTGMLLLEQVFTAGLSIALGIGIGKLTSIIFLPFLQTTENSVNQVPPFRVVFEATDTMRLYIVVAVMMSIGVGLLITHIRRLKVHQAVKLGEER